MCELSVSGFQRTYLKTTAGSLSLTSVYFKNPRRPCCSSKMLGTGLDLCGGETNHPSPTPLGLAA